MSGKSSKRSRQLASLKRENRTLRTALAVITAVARETELMVEERR